ncbi:Radical SAM domain protein [Ammonifex degensii KC4]|uniref:Radical SAM domain protein n=1 Tax=Ammonifex degensii (strain DSM 10501 / KC4) TaxID=429009 RepID=C9RB60_AMMDK|nr:radical SAM protein [Ammonifex degensii]ACX51487.1 Radical SAM domain protein [Ammonifex degensii KC4]
MGLVILKREHLKQKTDFMKLKMLFNNTLTRKFVMERLLQPAGDGSSRLEAMMDRMAEGAKPRGVEEKLFFSLMEIIRQGIGIPKEHFPRYLKHPNIRRTILNVAESARLYGVTLPQVFAAPLMVVWNLTYNCNLRCRHCYEDAGSLRPRNLPREELSREEKLALVEEIARANIPTLSFSGGEPLACQDFWEVAAKARELGLYLSMNTNGTLITRDVASRLKELDFAYVAVSVDSARPERHDEFRGVKGSWEKAVQGIRNLVSAGVTAVLSVTLTKFNFSELRELFRLGEELGVNRVMVYNFIPVGRGQGIRSLDLSPEEREEALRVMYEYMQSGGRLCSTAPQLGRVCLQRGRADLVPLAHIGAEKAKELAILAEWIGGCGVARAYLALQPDGTITPCVYMPEVKLGHVRTDRLIEVWRQHPFLEALRDRRKLWGNCGVCDYRYVCGGCRARALAYYGDPHAPDPGCIRNLAYCREAEVC